MEKKRSLSIIFGALVLVLAAYVISPPSVRTYVIKVAEAIGTKSKH